MFKRTKIGIIGAGFAGLTAARDLAKQKDLSIELIDRRNYHLFQPLLYQVAMAGLNPSEIAVPIRSMFSGFKNVKITMAEVQQVDVKKTAVYFDEQWHHYDYLILAIGAKHFYFGKDDWEATAPGLKTIEQATEIRRRILVAFEMAEKNEGEEQAEYLTFAVVGGGPTGVELAGAISEMAQKTLVKDYSRANLRDTKVYLIEGGPRVLAAFPENLSRRAEQDLQKMGVTVVKNKRASDLTHDGLKVGDDWLACKTIIWAAGVKPASLTETVESDKDAQGRVKVQADLSLQENSNVFACGDMTHFEVEANKSLPGIAPAAIQQGQFAAKSIKNDLKGLPRGQFKYWDKGIMATIGRSKAVVSSGPLQLTGLIAWLAWVFIHIVYLLRFRNRMFVFLQWVWSYFSFGKGARLIVHKTWRFYSGEPVSYHNK